MWEASHHFELSPRDFEVKSNLADLTFCSGLQHAMNNGWLQAEPP